MAVVLMGKKEEKVGLRRGKLSSLDVLSFFDFATLFKLNGQLKFGSLPLL